MIVAQFQVLAIQGEVEGECYAEANCKRDFAGESISGSEDLGNDTGGSGPRITWPYWRGTAVVISLLAY
jgi:hypothetical protein